ncbi:hypothetical protein K8T06_16525, partial [bacterium]|nr:hypothetical protein [bacterium]
MMKKGVYTIIVISVLSSMISGPISAWNYDEDRIPNGNVFSCDTCHGATTHTLNVFGQAYADTGNTWTETLALADSDDDGYSNGEELLDPEGVWAEGQANPGIPADVTNPGNSSSHPSDPTPTPTPTPAVTNTPEPTQTPQATATPGGCS